MMRNYVLELIQIIFHEGDLNLNIFSSKVLKNHQFYFIQLKLKMKLYHCIIVSIFSKMKVKFLHLKENNESF
jgi:hypothetical protein